MLYLGYENDYEERVTALARIMQQITFHDLEFYDYVNPRPKTFSESEIPLLSKRHQARIKKASKTKHTKLDTLACEFVCFVTCESLQIPFCTVYGKSRLSALRTFSIRM